MDLGCSLSSLLRRHVDVVLSRVEDVRDADLVQILHILHGGPGPDDDSRIHLIAVRRRPHPVDAVALPVRPSGHEAVLRRVDVERALQVAAGADVAQPGVRKAEGHLRGLCWRIYVLDRRTP